jgi:hypothetical protein
LFVGKREWRTHSPQYSQVYDLHQVVSLPIASTKATQRKMDLMSFMWSLIIKEAYNTGHTFYLQIQLLS